MKKEILTKISDNILDCQNGLKTIEERNRIHKKLSDEYALLNFGNGIGLIEYSNGKEIAHA